MTYTLSDGSTRAADLATAAVSLMRGVVDRESAEEILAGKAQAAADGAAKAKADAEAAKLSECGQQRPVQRPVASGYRR